MYGAKPPAPLNVLLARRLIKKNDNFDLPYTLRTN